MQHHEIQYADLRYLIDDASECGHFAAIALRSYCKVWRAGQPETLGNRKVPVDASGLRGDQKAREPGNRPHGYPALIIAVRGVGSTRAIASDYGRSSLGETVTVKNTSTILPEPSSPRPKHWCVACGDTINTGRPGTQPRHCSIECLEWDLEDARKSRDEPRASKLYSLRAMLRRRMGVRV